MAVEAEVLLPGATLQKRPRLAPSAPESSRQKEANDDVTVGEDPPSCNEGDLGSIPGLGRSPGEGKGYRSSILSWRIPWTV